MLAPFLALYLVDEREHIGPPDVLQDVLEHIHVGDEGHPAQVAVIHLAEHVQRIKFVFLSQDRNTNVGAQRARQ